MGVAGGKVHRWSWSPGSESGLGLWLEAGGQTWVTLLAHALVGVEVIAQGRVVFLSDDLGCLLHGLSVNAAHLGRPLVKQP